MPEDANRKGDRATERIVTLFKNLGWNLKSRTDVDVKTDEEGRKHGYGIDAYLTYEDPYGRHTYGNILESKSWQWGSINEGQVESFFETLLEKVEKGPNSEQFESTHNLGNEASLTNTGIVALWATDGFDSTDFREFVRAIDVPRKWELAKICLWGNDYLKRIAQIEDTYNDLKGDYEEVKIYYPDLTDEDGGRYDLITLEYLLSDFFFATGGDSSEQGFIFYFDEMDFDSLLFMYKSLRHYQLLSNHEQIDIFVPNRGYQTEPVEEEFIREFSGGKTEIEFKSMRAMANLQHLDSR
ncbi:hypothetical protein [Halorubrum sp. AS12]|uniref:hypothetical protein n=1 Tax=Halorubrum sp. AS12 TaxID=3409687 RepID=UPI003DA76F01